VLVIAGSPGMSGAACLTATAALRSGAGLVTAAVPQSIQSIVASFEPSYMTLGLPCDEHGELTTAAIAVASFRLGGCDAVAVGPGLGQSPAARLLVGSLIETVSIPLILDADALNVLTTDDLSAERIAPVIITPHPGELARLTKLTVAEINADRETHASQFSQQFGCTVVLKGAGTVISDGTEIYVNENGNSGMATGGSGDVLTGIVAALCGQGMSVFSAAVTAVHAHGLAGDLCAAATSERGMIASDLLKWLPRAWSQLETQR